MAFCKVLVRSLLQVGRLMVSSPVTTSVRRSAAICVRLIRSQGCDRAVGHATAWPGADHTRTLCRVSRRYMAIDTGTARLPASPSRALLRCVRRKQSTLPWKSLARGRWRSRHMAARASDRSWSSRTPAGPGTMHVRDVYGGRGHSTEESSQYLPSMRVPGWLGGTTLDWNAHVT